jgi:hypothetical protein
MSSIVVSGDTSGAITLAAPTTAGTSTLTLPSGASGTIAAQGVSTNIVSGTAVASTSGTSIDFTSIPSWVKRVTVMYDGVSTNGTSGVRVQLGDSGGIESTSYLSMLGQMANSSGSTGASQDTSGFTFVTYASSSDTAQGSIIFSNLSGNVWVAQGMAFRFSGAVYNIEYVSGSKTLSGTLDRVRITTVNGTDTFDAGSINILYE